MTAQPSPSVALDALREGLRPERRLSVSEWADANRQLSRAASSEPGQWRTSRTPYLREPMDNLSSSSDVQRVVLMFGAQLGKTEMGNNWVGYSIDHAPGPMLVVQPTVEVAKRYSKQRVAPMIAATPVLRDRVRDPRARDSGNTLMVKEFDGGVLIITGANSPAGLRMMPVAKLFMDEIDAYPADCGGEGDPVLLAEKRTTTFTQRKLLVTSTPTIRGRSRIEDEYNQSDRRRYYVPCPHCGNMDWLRWENIRYPDKEPDKVALVCIECEGRIDERFKTQMLVAGEWRATADGDGRTVGYHLSSLYSPLGWKSWSECVYEFEQAKRQPDKLKVFVNTVLAETWEERSEGVEPEAIRERLERYDAEVPVGVGVLVASVDVQGDRLEAQVVGFGSHEESWLIAFTQLIGDPSRAQVWYELDAFLSQEFEHVSGRKLTIATTVVDSGGAHTEEVYRYCAARWSRRRVFPIKGGSETGKPLVGRPSSTNRYKVPLFVLCTDAGKERVVSRLRIASAGPGMMHLPAWIDDEYIEQLASEKAVRKYVKGRGSVRVWQKVRERNEALDLTVYSLAALYIMGPTLVKSLPEHAARWAKPVDADEVAAKPVEPAAQRKRPGKSWVKDW